MARLFQRMTAIHTVSEDARLNLLSFFPGIRTERVQGILHGIDTRYFRDSVPASLRPRIGVPGDVPLIGFLGRFMGQKGFRLLVDAIEQVVKGQLLPVIPHVVTFGWNGYIREDYDYLRSKGLADYFHQHEQTHDVGGMLKAVDLVVMPSRWEACGLLAMEALAAGVPILGSDCVGLREVLAGSPARPFRTGDSSALRLALIEEINNLPARKLQFANYQPEAVARFDIDRPARALADLYSRLAKPGAI
jgi:glycosyltransferase involved in cell wall biosynthesis